MLLRGFDGNIQEETGYTHRNHRFDFYHNTVVFVSASLKGYANSAAPVDADKNLELWYAPGAYKNEYICAFFYAEK